MTPTRQVTETDLNFVLAWLNNNYQLWNIVLKESFPSLLTDKYGKLFFFKIYFFSVE